MATVLERKIGAVVGSAVCDAAAQPLHWMYDLGKMQALVGDKAEIEFHEPAGNPFYRRECGKNTCYGDQAYVLLESLVVCKGLDTKDFAKRLNDMFGEGSEYDVPALRSGGKPDYPIQGPWRHGSIKDFLANYQMGKDETGSVKDEQVDGCAKIAPVVAMYAGRPEMLEKVEAAVKVTQKPGMAVAAAMVTARLLEQYILHGSRPDALEAVITQLSDPKRNHPQKLDDGMVDLLEEVIEVKNKPHAEVVANYFVKS